MKLPSWHSELTLDPKETIDRDAHLDPEKRKALKALDQTNPAVANHLREQWANEHFNENSGKLQYHTFRDADMRRVLIPDGDSGAWLRRMAPEGAVVKFRTDPKSTPEARAYAAKVAQKDFDAMVAAGFKPSGEE